MTLTKELLNEYALCERELKRLEEKIEYFASYVTPSEHGVVMASMQDYPYARTHIVLSGSDVKKDDARQEKIRQLLITLNERKEIFLSIELEVGKAVESINDTEMRTIIEDCYVKGMTHKEIADELGYTSSAITKKINRFLEKL